MAANGIIPRRGGHPLHGTWQVFSGEAFGKEVSGKDEWGMRIAFSENKATWHFDMGGGKWKSFDGICRIDPDGKKGTLDLGQPESKDSERVGKAIYRIEDGVLSIHMDKDRPADFEQPSATKLKLRRYR